MAALICAVALTPALPARAIRLKDVASVKGVRENQLVGYGLVVGLNGTGDKSGTAFTIQSLASMLGKLGVGVDASLMKVKNVAAVMATGTLSPFARSGSATDVTLSSIGDASSLEGGTLVMTPLFGSDGQVYAIAQGPISTGGFSAGAGGSSVQKNHPTVGRISNGATIERELDYAIGQKNEFEIAFGRPDFTTAQRAVRAINAQFGVAVAEARDSGTLRLRVPSGFESNVVGFLSEVEAIEIAPDEIAKVVLNERTGTVVMGANVRISQVAVSHGSLSVTISTTTSVSQPGAFSGGTTAVVPNTDISAVEEPARLLLLGGGITINDLVRGLNAVGVTPRDLIAILQAIKAAGALSAALEII
jgi:flagellar P-ring protein precursor FlgI